MALKIFILLSLLTAYVASDSCVTYDFEENYDNLFSTYGTCYTIQAPSWIIGEYSDLDIASPNERSTKFIKPSANDRANCVASFHLTMHFGGIYEFNFYLDLADDRDNIQIMSFSDEPDTFSAITGIFFVNSGTGWQTVRTTVNGPPSYRGYVSIRYHSCIFFYYVIVLLT